jgi:hypothetical protein
MVTFEEARKLVLEKARSNWNSSMGELTTAPEGFESPAYWRVRAVAQEELDGDDNFVQMDEPVYLVNKQTKVVTVTTYLADPDRFDKMTPVSA